MRFTASKESVSISSRGILRSHAKVSPLCIASNSTSVDEADLILPAKSATQSPLLSRSIAPTPAQALSTGNAPSVFNLDHPNSGLNQVRKICKHVSLVPSHLAFTHLLLHHL